MPENDIKDLRSKEEQELRFDLRRLAKELFELRFKASAEDVATPHRIGAIRRGIARIKTLLRERELAAARPGEAQGTRSGSQEKA